MPDKEKAINLLTMCRRAGKLTLGFDASMDSVKAGVAPVAVIADDISAKTVKEVRFICGRNNAKVLKGGILTEDFFTLFHKTYGVAAVCDKGFAKKLCEYLDESEE